MYIPSEGSGLGSSSSVTVGLLHALYAYQGELVKAEQLAREACEIEIDLVCNPIGIQDQYIAAYGGLGAFEFHKDGQVSQKAIELCTWDQLVLRSRLLLFFLSKTRKSSTVLHEQRENINNKVESLCRMRDMALTLRGCSIADNLDILGEIMHQGWSEEKTLASKVSDPEIDALYQRALDAGALGGKVAGTGGGGFLLLYIPRDKQDWLRERLSHLRELPFMIESDGSKVIFNQRRTKWK